MKTIPTKSAESAPRSSTIRLLAKRRSLVTVYALADGRGGRIGDRLQDSGRIRQLMSPCFTSIGHLVDAFHRCRGSSASSLSSPGRRCAAVGISRSPGAPGSARSVRSCRKRRSPRTCAINSRFSSATTMPMRPRWSFHPRDNRLAGAVIETVLSTSIERIGAPIRERYRPVPLEACEVSP